MTVTTDPTAVSTTPPVLSLTALEEGTLLDIANLHNVQDRRAALNTLHLDLKRETLALQASREETRRDLETVQARLRSAQNDLTQFQQQVRDVAIRTAEQQSWCDAGLNEVLEELGLDRKVTEWSVEVEIQATQIVTVTVEAVDEDEARDRVRNGDVDLSYGLDRNGWEWQNSDVEFLSVEPGE